MGQYHSTFYGIENSSELSSTQFQHFFERDGSNSLSSEEGGSIQFTTDAQTYSLMVLPNANLGVLLSFSCYDKQKKQTQFCFFSVGDVEKINDIQDVGDEEFYPTGSFVQSHLAWLAIEDFFSNPFEKSSRIKWIDSNDIQWPEDY